MPLTPEWGEGHMCFFMISISPAYGGELKAVVMKTLAPRGAPISAAVSERLANPAEGRVHISSRPHGRLLSLGGEITGFTLPVLYVNVKVSRQGA